MDFSDVNICFFGSSSFSVESLELLHKNNFKWDETTCSNFTELGAYDCLVYANNNGCVNTLGPPYIPIRTASSGGTRNVKANLNIHDGFNARCIM